MSQEFEDMICLLSCSARGIDPELTGNININKIKELAISQGVWPLVFLSLKKLYLEKKINIDKNLFENWNKQVMVSVMLNVKKKMIVHECIKLLEKNEILCCMLKGEVLAHLYKNPDFRISSDADIYVGVHNEKKAVKILDENGYIIEYGSNDSYHTRCYHPVGVLIELHTGFYDKIYEDVWFDNQDAIQEEYRKIKVDGEFIVTTLGVNDGLIFTVLHFIKHFLFQGVGIRQLIDVLVYMTYYKSEIDWEKFNALMCHLKFDKLFGNLIGIGVKHLDFCESNFNEYSCNDELMSDILADIESGGVFGQNEDERSGFYKLYTEERFKSIKDEDYNKYIKALNKRSFFRLIFPDIQTYYTKYPYLKKTQLLLPVAWIHRITDFIVAVLKKEKTFYKYLINKKPNTEDDLIRKRMDLMRSLDII